MENAFIVRLSSSVWTARKMDKAATREARETAGASAKAGVKVYKSVIAADALDKVASIADAARKEHRKRTVPWTYEGVGAITAEGYAPYKTAMGRFKTEFDVAVSHFLSVYEVERERARDYLGNMFNSLDYPTVGALREKFSFATHAEPLPHAEHFAPVGLPPEVVSEIRQDIVRTNTTALQNANATAWERVVERITKLKEGLAAYKPSVNGSPVTGKFHELAGEQHQGTRGNDPVNQRGKRSRLESRGPSVAGVDGVQRAGLARLGCAALRSREASGPVADATRQPRHCRVTLRRGARTAPPHEAPYRLASQWERTRTMFQKRHMECVAYRMQRIQPDPNQPERMDQWWITVAELGDMFSVSNPNFDRDRFERACQRGANVKARTAGDISPQLVRMAKAQWKREGKL